MSLFKADFARDSILDCIPSVKSSKVKSRVLLAYRLAKYAQMNKFGNEKLNYPQLAIRVLANDFKDIIKLTLDDVFILLLDCVVEGSYLLSAIDIKDIFAIDNNYMADLIAIERIAKSGTKITLAKQRRYKKEISKRALIIKAASVIVGLRNLSLIKAKNFPIKVYERYLPLFDIYPEIGNLVAFELKKQLLYKVKTAQRLTDKYNLTTGDIFKYFSITNSIRLKGIKV